MKQTEVMLWIRARAEKGVSIKDRHDEFLASMAKIGPPLGFADIDLPLVPECGANLSAGFTAKLSTRGIKFSGHYIFRGERYAYDDSAKFDDLIYYGFSVNNRKLDYESILRNDFPKIIEAFRGYSAKVSFGYYDLAYIAGVEPSEDGESFFNEDGSEILNNATYNSLVADRSIDVDGRNNVFVLRPAQYWDSELCRRALGYGPDEVINRLHGSSAEARRMMDGVYVLLDTEPDITFETFLQINKQYKALLGLK